VAFLLIALALFALLGRIFWIQYHYADEYNRIVLSQRQSTYSSRTIPYKRGDIYDRNGTKLAFSEKVYTLILDPAQMREAESQKTANGEKSRSVIGPTAAAIGEYFGVDRHEVEKIIEDNINSSYVRFRQNVTYDEKNGFLAFQSEKNSLFAASEDPDQKKNRVRGVWFEDSYKRRYPYNSLACSVLGFESGSGMNGTGGVEQYYNDVLTGTNGREYGYLDDEANLERVIRNPRDGDSLILTIDASIQAIAEKYIKEWMEGEIGSKSAACIVMDPNTAEILAMAGSNTFDLNDPLQPGNYSRDEMIAFGTEEAIADYKRRNPTLVTPLREQIGNYYTTEQILEMGRKAAIYKNLRNICVSDTYEPGSTQKIFTVAGAMEEGIIDRWDEFNCEGNISLSDGVNNWKINCVNRNGHGLLDVTGGITQSCNVVMMNIAFREGDETFMKYERVFGFGDYTGVDLPAEASTRSMGFDSDTVGKTTLATNSFGQNYNCTMIQMASAYCSVINGGNYYQPHVLKRIETSEGALIEEKAPVLIRETVSEETCSYLREALFETVEHGTGSAAAVPGYTVGGKTGTAQKLPRSDNKYVVSFCGFAPVENPKLLCYVIVDEPSLPGEEAAHSSFASGIFSKIMAEALPALSIYPEN